MLPYDEDGQKLEELLEKLFEDDDDDDIVVLSSPALPRPRGCCRYNYGSYG